MLKSLLPDRASEVIAPYYYRYRSYLADREYEPPTGRRRRADDAPDHIALVVVDCLRPDFAPDVPIEFSSAVAGAPWTFPSVTSMHTGLLPNEHGSVAHTALHDQHASRDDGEYTIPAQTDSYPALVADLDAAGYDTLAATAFVTPFLSLQGWYQTHNCFGDVGAERVVESYQSWRRRRERTFAYLHLGDLHAPVSPPQRYLDRYEVDLSLPRIRHISKYATDFDEDDPDCRYYRDQKFNLYRAAFDYVSDQLAGLVEACRDDTAIFVVGDHGEGMWEHQEQDRRITDSRPNYCFGHGGTPFDVIARVPAGVSLPDGSPAVPRGGWGSLCDLPATMADLALEGGAVDGHSWVAPIPEDRAVVCEGTRYGAERKAVYRGDAKVIRSEMDDVTLTARIVDDRETFVDLPPDVVADLLSELPNRWEDGDMLGSASDFLQGQLEALGYK